MNKFNIYNQRSIHFIPTVKTIFYKSFVDQKYRPDIIVFDLEDSVAPKAKDKARDTFLKFLETKDAKRILKSSCNFVAFRINNTKSKWFSSDMKLAKHPLIDIIIVPKAEDKKDIKKVRSRTKKPIGICLETIKGLLNANSFLPELSDSKGDFVIVGHEDPSSDYFIERPKNLNAINPLSYFILNALTQVRRHNLQMVDGPSRFINDIKHLKNESKLTRSWGCVAKCTIHPSQVKIVNTIFNKSNEKKTAKKNLDVLSNLEDGTLVTRNEQGDMMDTPSLKMYKNLINRVKNKK